MSRIDVLLQDFGVPNDDTQNIVKIVCDSAGQSPNGIHLLRLAELVFEPSAIRDIPVHDHQMFHFPAVAQNCTGSGFKNSPGAVLMAHAVFNLPTNSFRSRLGGSFLHQLPIVRMYLLQRRGTLKFLQAVTENFLVSGAVVDSSAISVNHRDHVSGVLSDQTKHFFPFDKPPPDPIDLELLKNYIDIEKKHQTNQSAQDEGHLDTVCLPCLMHNRNNKRHKPYSQNKGNEHGG